MSKPNFCGSIALPAIAPISVPRFQKLKRPMPVVQNAILRNLGDDSASANAVVSSITKCAANNRRGKLPAIDLADDESAKPYTKFRAASKTAPPNAAIIEPPAPTTLIAENCDAPVNTNSDNAHVCHTLAPALTDATPNDNAKMPTAPPRVKLETTTRRVSLTTKCRPTFRRHNSTGHASAPTFHFELHPIARQCKSRARDARVVVQ